MLDVGSPFDYESNALLYCPTHLPDPRDTDRREERLIELEQLIVAAGGRTLALFTSFAAMNEAAERLDGRLPWPVLLQGAKSKAALLDEFASNEEASLFATTFILARRRCSGTVVLARGDRPLAFPAP